MIWRQSSPVSTDVLVNQRQLMPGRPAYYCCLKLLNCFWKQRSSWSEEIRSKVLPTGCRVHYSHKMIVQTSDFYWSSDWKIFRYLLFRYLLLIIWLEDLATSVCYWWSDWWMLRCVCGPRCWATVAVGRGEKSPLISHGLSTPLLFLWDKGWCQFTPKPS